MKLLTPEKEPTTREQKLRVEWGESLHEHLVARKFTVKDFHHELIKAGADVSITSVYSWLSGQTSPSPWNQAYCAHVLRAPAHRLFPHPSVT